MRNRNKNKGGLRRLIHLLVFSAVFYFVANLGMRYLLTALTYAKDIEKKIETSVQVFAFKLEYLIIPPENFDLLAIIFIAFA